MRLLLLARRYLLRNNQSGFAPLLKQPYLNNFRSFKIRFAALCPGAPVTNVPPRHANHSLEIQWRDAALKGWRRAVPKHDQEPGFVYPLVNALEFLTHHRPIRRLEIAHPTE